MATGQKAAVVTGAASGLGPAMALGLVESGMDVVAVDRNATALAALAPAKGSAAGSICPVGRPHAARRVRPDRRSRAGEVRTDRRAGQQCRHRPGIGSTGSATQPD